MPSCHWLCQCVVSLQWGSGARNIRWSSFDTILEAEARLAAAIRRCLATVTAWGDGLFVTDRSLEHSLENLLRLHVWSNPTSEEPSLDGISSCWLSEVGPQSVTCFGDQWVLVDGNCYVEAFRGRFELSPTGEGFAAYTLCYRPKRAEGEPYKTKATTGQARFGYVPTDIIDRTQWVHVFEKARTPET